MSVLMIGLTGFFVCILVFLSVVDLSIYSYKKRIIGSAIDYAVSAAVQEIDVEKSRAGLARAFSADGQVSMTGIYFDEMRADKAFNSSIIDNMGPDIANIKSKMVRVAATPESDGVYYSISDKNGIKTGHAESMNNLQDILNNNMNGLGGEDSHTVFVNENAASNPFEKRPYYMVFIRDYEIDGIITRRKATFICFKSARIYR